MYFDRKSKKKEDCTEGAEDAEDAEDEDVFKHSELSVTFNTLQ